MSKPYVFVTRKLPDEALRPLKERYNINVWPDELKACDRKTLLDEAKKADALLTMLSDQIDRELLSQAKHLKVVANLAVGYDNIDLNAANEYGDRKSTRLNSSHVAISYAVFCLKKKIHTVDRGAG